ncbi:MAG: hypothetical protein EYC70_03330 [Planctomycetota bacterium]|nr:MAG: hypothetical protein EYC70_03330 [Planctomycetota bacterium]
MKVWLRLILGAVATGLIWAAAWAAAGALIGFVDRGGFLDARWLGPPIGLHPGFVGGVVFSVVLGIAARPRRFDELSLPTVLACGGMVGLLLGVLPFVINPPPGDSPLWLVAAVVIGCMTLMSAVSAAGSLALARTAKAVRR